MTQHYSQRPEKCIVLQMSYEMDIRQTEFATAWGNPSVKLWSEVVAGDLKLPNGKTILVVAHGNNKEIGGKVGKAITPEGFIELVAGCMSDGGTPDAIYISTCGLVIAGFAASVRIAADKMKIWAGIPVYGHNCSVAGKVPGPGEMGWTKIEPERAKKF